VETGRLRPIPAWWRKARSLKIEIALAFGVVIALMVTLGVVVDLSEQRSTVAIDKLLNSDGRMADLSLRSELALLKARGAESEFLLSVDRLGVAEARERYVSPMRTFLLDMREYLTSVRIIAADPIFLEKIDRIEQQAQQYEDGFLAFVGLHGKPGQVDAANRIKQDYIAAARHRTPAGGSAHHGDQTRAANAKRRRKGGQPHTMDAVCHGCRRDGSGDTGRCHSVAAHHRFGDAADRIIEAGCRGGFQRAGRRQPGT